MYSILLLIGTIGAISASSYNYRIVGGEDAAPSEFPFVVALRENGKRECSGVIMTDSWILTAASCLDENYLKIERNYILAGEYSRSAPDFRVQIVKVAKFIEYDYYNEFGEPYNDIGLVKTQKPLVFNDRVYPLLRFTTKNYTEGIIASWGSKSLTKDVVPAAILQKATVPIFPSSYCTKYSRKYRNNPNLVCVGRKFVKKGACKGDAGGPLFALDDDGNYVLIAILSHVPTPCGTLPGVYVKVSPFMQWIRTTISKN